MGVHRTHRLLALQQEREMLTCLRRHGMMGHLTISLMYYSMMDHPTMMHSNAGLLDDEPPEDEQTMGFCPPF